LVWVADDRCLERVYVAIHNGVWGIGSTLVSAVVWGFGIDFCIWLWGLVFLFGDSHRLGGVFIGVFNVRGVCYFFWVFCLDTTSFVMLLLSCRYLFVWFKDYVINKILLFKIIIIVKSKRIIEQIICK